MRRSCVIDTSTLVNLTVMYELGIFSLLRNLFDRIHIPLAVKSEYDDFTKYDSRRRDIAARMRLNEGFLSLCSQYDQITHAFLRTAPGIDAGEAEAAAQHKKVYSNYVLSDDLVFINSIRNIDSNTRFLGTVHLIAWLDLGKFVIESERNNLLRTLHSHSLVNANGLRSAYQLVARELGLTLTKKELNEKSSIKRLGLEQS